MLFGIPVADLAAFLWFVVCWAGFTWFADVDVRRQQSSLMGLTATYRRDWMRAMWRRENRIVDTTLVGTLSRSASFFAQTSIFILAGLIAVIGAPDVAREVIADLPLARYTTAALWEAKVALLAVIFVYAFFKFTWSLRQFNYQATMIGATPPPPAEGSPEERVPVIVERAARMSDLAVNSFNGGVRAYYFGLAALAWFLQPWLFALASAWVVLVLWRREFRSRTHKALMR